MEKELTKNELWNLWYQWTHAVYQRENPNKQHTGNYYSPCENLTVPWCDKNENYDVFEKKYYEWVASQNGA
jgi:hypothetical protein